MTELIKVAEQGDIERVRELLEEGAAVHTKNDALRRASYNGHLEVIRLLLLQAGANVHAVDDEALRWASERGDLEVVRLLLQFGADVHAWNDEALCKASKCACSE